MASIGIDLGTTNSAGAYYDGQKARVLRGDREDLLVPSVVAYRKPRGNGASRNPILVGQPALDWSASDPTNAIFSIKRLMGRAYDEPKVAEVRERFNYEIVPASESDDPGARVLLGGQEYTPTNLSALIIQKIKENAERALGEPVTHAVITVPAYFEERQRAATIKAGQQAGLIVKKIIDEPSAAAVAYGVTVSRGERRRLLVFDLGGGTFDVSIIQTVQDPRGRDHFDVLEHRGDNWLGGDDFDLEIVDEINGWIEKQCGFNPAGDKAFQLKAKRLAEKAKKTLSTAEEADIIMPAAFKHPEGDFIDLDMVITREHFNDLIRPHADRCIRHVKEALARQGLTAEDISNVLMVGGSAAIPLIHDGVVELFGSEKVQEPLNPYHAVALGAGILAGALRGIQCPNEDCLHVNDESREHCQNCGEPLAVARTVGDVEVQDITPLSFGISAVRGEERDVFEVIIPKGTHYPLKTPKTRTFFTTADNFLRIPVYEGINPVASKNEEQGVIELNPEDLDREGKHVPANTRVEVAMNYGRSRELHVKIYIPDAQIELELPLRHDRPRQQPQTTPNEQDKWQEELERATMIAERFLSKYDDYMENREKMRLERDIERAHRVVDGDNAVEGKEALHRLVVALDSCGVASLIFMAERAREGAAPERAKRIGEAINQLKNSWYDGDKDGVDRLKTPLRAVIAAEIRTRRDQKAVPGQIDFGGLLRSS